MARRQRTRLASPREVRLVLNEVRYRILPELEREFAEAHEYVQGRRDKPSHHSASGRPTQDAGVITGGGEHSDPTGDTAADQEYNRDRLRDVSTRVVALKDEANVLLDKVKRVFDVSEAGQLQATHIPSAREVVEQKEAQKRAQKQAAATERKQLERRIAELDQALAG